MSTVALGVVSLLALCLLGWAVLAPLRATYRDALLPAAPVVGAAWLAAVMSSTSFWLTAFGGLVVSTVLAAGLVVLGVARGRRPWRIAGRTVVTAASITAVGAVGAAVALLPVVWAGDGRAMSPNSSNDIFYYVSESEWLAHHPIDPAPAIGAVPGEGDAALADNPMGAALDAPLRIGQAMVQAALNEVTGQRAVDTIMVLTALWVLLVAPAAYVTARALRVGPGVSAGLAVVSSTSAMLLQQYYQQNVDALLGVGLAVLTIGTGIAAADRRLPVWPAAVVLAGLVAVYTEYALYVAPALAAGVLLRTGPRYRRTLGQALAVVAAAVLLAPAAWVRAVGVLTIDRSADTAELVLTRDGWFGALSRIVGTSPLTALTPSRSTVVLVALLAVGCLLAVVLDRLRGMWAALLAVGGGYVLAMTADGRGYSQLRATSLFVPLLLVAAVVGWGALLRVLRRRGGSGTRVVRVVLASGLAVSTVVWAGVNVRSAVASIDRGYALSRQVDDSFDEAARWVADVGGPRGEDVTVLVPDLFDQIWIADVLSDDPLVSYAAIRPDYLGRTSHWAGELDRYLLVGAGAVVDAADAAVVAENQRFTLLDLSAGPVVAVTPTELPTWSAVAHPDGGLTGPDHGVLLVLRSPSADGSVALELSTPAVESAGEDLLLTVVETGQTFAAVTTGTSGALVPILLGDLPMARVLVDVGADAVASTDQFTLNGVSRAP